MNSIIKIQGARQHNLKNVNLEIPKNKLVVFTGVSGSGKSSLAYDTIYAEGQRRYVESLSTYARQFLGVMEKPDVDTIEGLSPAISIDQKAASRNPRSTVGTVTEVYDYLRLLFARIGHPHCPVCGREIATQSQDQMVETMLEQIKNRSTQGKSVKLMILSPVVRDKKGEFSGLLDNIKAKGYQKVRIDGFIKDLAEGLVLIKTNKHTIEVVIDKISFVSKDIKDVTFVANFKSRLSESLEQALKLSDGLVILSFIDDPSFEIPDNPKNFEDHLYSEMFTCPVDNIQLPEIEPRSFSFNSPHGACPNCSGLGTLLKVDENLIYSRKISITEGGVLPFGNMYENDTWFSRLVTQFCLENSIDTRMPLGKLNTEQINLLSYGTGDKTYKVEGKNRFGKPTYIYEEFKGIIPELEKRYQSTDSSYVRSEIEKYMRETVCPECEGKRLKKEALSITIGQKSISDISDLSITTAFGWINDLPKGDVLSPREHEIARFITREIRSRLQFLVSVGLEYLTLSRSAKTLSSGEAQRIRLASQIGTGLTGVLYVLDEPTIGLHMRDNQKLIDTLKNLRDLGNSVLVVEHDDQMMKQSDYIFDFGPGAGRDGGEVVAHGRPKELPKIKTSVTGKFLDGSRKIKVFKSGQTNMSQKSIKLVGCTNHNLKNISVELPLGNLIVITGVSGSGKSSLLVETVYPALASYTNPLYRGDTPQVKNVSGIDEIDKVVLISQSPIGRTPRSNPATYTKVFDFIREVFANTKDAKISGFKKSRFSFNVKSGRCENCQGQGQIKIEMQFMSDIWVRCEVCGGSRYSTPTLEVKYRGKNISEVLDMSVTEAKEFFHSHPQIIRKLETIDEVGLGYIQLGQSATTLSGGESQRIKLSAELSKKSTGKTVYILDEPTTGLHFLDIEKLLNVLHILVARGNTVIVIEHNIDVIKNADHIIDIGPEGGQNGGEIIAAGSIDDIINNKASYTGAFIKKYS